MKACLLNFVQDLFKFPWTREEFLRCNSFRESYDTFHDRIGDCSFDEYLEFFREFNMECSTLEKSIDKLSDEQLEQVSGGRISRFIAIPMVALTLLSGVSSVTGFAASIKAPGAVSVQADVQDEWAKTRDFVARAGDPWLSMLPVEGEDGFDEYKDPKVDFDGENEEVVYGEERRGGRRRNQYHAIYGIVQNFMDYTDGKKVKNELPGDLGGIVDVADGYMGDVTQKLPRALRIAKYIYVWIAKNIKYDNELAARRDHNEREYRARPDVVFEKGNGVCEGFAKLARLMMRMAGIPCALVGNLTDTSTGVGHAFNAIYVEKANGQKGWTLMDATWGMQENRLDAKTNEKRLYDNFPAAYDNKSLKEDNRSMMHNIYHQIKYIDENYKEGVYTLNGVKYTVSDNEILVTSDLDDPVSLQIPPEILALGRKIEIGEGIKKYKCSSDEEIDIGNAIDLQEINTDDSRRYKFRDGVLRDNYNGKIEMLHKIDENVNYTLKDNYIYVSANYENPVSLEIPKGILDLGLKIEVGPGIKEYIYSDDEEIDISEAKDLQSIKTPENGKYKFKDGVLYDNGGNKKAVGILPKIDGFKYDLKDNYIYVSANYENPVSLKIPKGILDLGLRIEVGPGIKEYIYSDDEEIDISEAKDLQSIKTPENGKYKFKDGVLYENDENGNKKAVGILPRIDGFKYDLKDNYIFVSYDGYIQTVPPLKIPQEILNLKRKIKIGFGVEEYICSGNEEIDIGEAYTLKSVTGSLERYSKLADGILYERVKDKKGNEEDKAVGVLPEIDGFRYSLSDSTITVSGDTDRTLEIPKTILGMYENPKVKIGGGIKRYKYSGNEEIDISEAENLEFIDDMPPEGRYSKFKDGILYEKDKATEKAVGMVPKKIGGISYSLSGSAISVSHHYSYFDDYNDNGVPTMPKNIRALKKKTKIGSEIVNYKCVGDEKIDISEANDLEFIDVSHSDIYGNFSNGVLYYKNGGRIAALGPRASVEIGGVTYSRQSKGTIKISSEHEIPYFITPPPEMLAPNSKVVIGKGITGYKCSQNEEIDIVYAENLIAIDAGASEKYSKFEDGVLYYKEGYKDDEKVAYLAPGRHVNINKVDYSRDADHSIQISSTDLKTGPTQIPKSILDQRQKEDKKSKLVSFDGKGGPKVKIRHGIEHYVCSGNEKIDISEARDLRFIDTSQSERYILIDHILYEKGERGRKKAVAVLPRISEFNYSLREDGSIYVSSASKNSNDLEIPESILRLHRRIVLGPGIKEYKCSGDEEIDISEAKDLQSITDLPERYSKFEGGVLYKKDESVVDLKPGASVVVDRVKYYRDQKDFHSITVSAAGYGSSVTLTNTPKILDLGHKIVIGEGIEAYKCYGSEEIDISGAYNLQFIDLTISSVYSDFSKGVLYKKDMSVADLIPGSSVVIGEFEYCREYSDCHSIYVSGNPNNFTTLTPPPEILNLNCKIKIGRGIREYKCSRDEEIDISDATDLEGLDASNSQKYKYQDFVLYRKGEIEKEEVVGIMPNIECFHYSLKEDGSIYVAGPKNIRSDFWGKNRKTIPYCLHIPPSILNLKKKIVIGEGISTYMHSDYSGEVDISEAVDLSLISTPELGFCSVEGGILYQNMYGVKKAVGFWPKIDGVTYSIGGDSISVVSDPKKPVDLKIKKEILDMHRGKRIKIGEGIKTYTCSGDEEIDISGAKNLQSITGNSERYSKFENGVLYKRDGRLADLKPGASVEIDEVKYCRQSQDAIKVSSKTKITDSLQLPPEILALKSKIIIGEGIMKYKCSDDEEIDISGAKDLQSITGLPERYSEFKSGVLYYRDGGKVADLKPGASVKIGEFKYDRRHDGGNYIIVSASPGSHAVLKNLALNSRIVIGGGIEQYEYSGNEKIDITQATELKMINTGNSTRYRFADGILYEKDGSGTEKAIAILPVIDGVYYNLFYDCIYVYDDHSSGDAVLKKVPKAIKALSETLPNGIKVGTIAKYNFIKYEG